MFASIAVIAMILMPLSGLQINTAQASGLQVTGRVVSPSGAALSSAGGWVQIDPAAGGPGFGEPIQNDGTFTLNGLTAGQYNVMLNYGGAGDYTAPAPFLITIGATNVNLGNIKLVMPAISGVLLPPSGSAPVTNASINLRSQDYTVNIWIGTDPVTGTFKFGGINPGTYILAAEAPAGSGYANATAELEYTGTAITNYQLRLAMPNVKGKIVSSTGGSLAYPDMAWMNARLHNEDYTISRDANVDRTSHEFIFGTVPSGSYILEFDANGFSETPPTAITVSVTSGVLKNLGNIRMSRSQLQGTITDPSGDPVQNANIQVHNDDWSKKAWANTDQNGAYRIGGLAAGIYTIEVQAPWGGSSGLVSPEPQQVTLTLGGTITKNLRFVQATKFLRGTVRYAVGTGAQAVVEGGVAGAQVNLNKDGGFGNASATTDSSGNYEIALSGGIWNMNVQPANYPGAPAADWFYAGPSLSVTFANNGTIENKTMNVGVERATASIKGKVTKADGTPVTQAWVDARNGSGAGQGTNVQPNGTFTLRVKAGTYTLNIFGDQSMTFPDMQVSVKDGEIKNIGTVTAKTKDAKIIGKFVDASGRPVQGLQVGAFQFNAKGWSNGTSDENGQFVLAVTSGRWGVNMDNGGNSSYVYSGQPVDVDVKTETSTVTFEDNPRLVMELTRADATIQGNVVDTDGNVVTGFCAWAWAQPKTAETQGKDGEFMGQRFGGPVNCQNGSFSISVPSKVASTYIIGIDTPPNTVYSPEGTQTVAVLADITITKNLVVKANDATLKGNLVDQAGDPVKDCTSPRGWFGDVNVFGNGGWKGGPINPDCSFSFSLLSGEYNYGWWIDDSRFLQTPPSDEKITIKAGDNTLKIKVLRSDVTIEGTVVNPSGKGVDAYVWAGNTGGEDEKQNDADMNFGKNIFTGTKTEQDGTFSLGLLSGQVWEVGTGLPQGSQYMPAELSTIDLKNGSAPDALRLKLQEALGTLSGSVTIGNSPAQFGYVHCWSEQGGFTGGEVMNGKYEVNYVQGDWHCQADSFNGDTFYQSDEALITVTDQKSLQQDFTLGESIFSVPSTVTATFDAGEVRNIELENGVRINIPSGALGDAGTNVTVTASPNVNVNQTKTDKLFGVGYEFSAKTADGTDITTFNSNVTIIFPYTDAQLEEMGVTEDALVPKYYDSTTNTWQLPIGITVDTENNTISIQTNHFTTFGIMRSGITGPSGGAQKIVASAKAGGGPHVTVWDANGELTGSFMAYADTFRGGVNAVIGDIDGDGVGEVVTVPDSAAGGQVRAFEQDGTFIGEVWPYGYGTSWRGTLSLALADIDGDGSDEVIVAPKSNGGPNVRTYNFTGSGFGLHSQFNAYNTSLRTGIKVYSEDVTGDGTAEIVTVPMPGAPAHVRVLNQTGGLVGQFYAFTEGYRGSANITFGDGDRDGDNDLVLAPAVLGGPQVRVVDGGGQMIYQEFLWNSNWRMGFTAAIDDTWEGGHMHIIAAPSQGSGPQMRVWDIDPGRHSPYSQGFAYNESFRGGVDVVVADVDSDGVMEAITAPGAGGGPHIRSFEHGFTGSPELNFMSHASAFRGGVNIDIGR
jgi:protocatechuate 3,4-dioxygenase beta subunit